MISEVGLLFLNTLVNTLDQLLPAQIIKMQLNVTTIYTVIKFIQNNNRLKLNWIIFISNWLYANTKVLQFTIKKKKYFSTRYILLIKNFN